MGLEIRDGQIRTGGGVIMTHPMFMEISGSVMSKHEWIQFWKDVMSDEE